MDNQNAALSHWVDADGGRVVVSLGPASPLKQRCWEVYDLHLFLRESSPNPADAERTRFSKSFKSLIQQTIDPASWKANGGFAVCESRGERMFVLQTEENHREISSILIQLKETDLDGLYHRLRGLPWPADPPAH